MDEQQRLKALLEAAPDATVTVDAAGQIVLANSRVEHLLGYRPDDLVGQSVDQLLPERYRTGHPGHRASFMASPRARPMGTGLDLAALRRDGSEVPVEISLSPLELDGNLLTVAALRDISEHRRIEQMLRRQAALLDLVPTAVIVRDLRSAIEYWNPTAEQLYGWTAAEARGQVTHKLLRTSFPESLEALEATLLREGRWEGELVHTLRNGAQIVVASRQALQRDDSGRAVAILEINTDITDRKRIEAEQLRLFREVEAAEMKFRGLLESAPDAVVIVGQDGRISLVNRQTEALFGYERDELLGQSVEVLVPERYRQVHIGHRAAYFAAPQTRSMGLGLAVVRATQGWQRIPGRNQLECGAHW